MNTNIQHYDEHMATRSENAKIWRNNTKTRYRRAQALIGRSKNIPHPPISFFPKQTFAATNPRSVRSNFIKDLPMVEIS